MMPQHTRLLFVLLLFCHATSSFSSSPAAASSASAAAATVPAHAPSFCKTGSGAAYQGADGPTTMSWAGNMLKVYHNLYHHNKKWYAVLDRSSNASRIDAGIAANTILVKLPTTDSKAFQESIKVGMAFFLWSHAADTQHHVQLSAVLLVWWLSARLASSATNAEFQRTAASTCLPTPCRVC